MLRKEAPVMRRYQEKSGRLLTALCSAGLCAAALGACGSAGTTAPSPADEHLPQPLSSDKPLLRCSSAQTSAASGAVRVMPVISSQTVHVAVGEQVDITQSFAPMRPDGTGIGQLFLRAGQQDVCQSGNVEGRFTGRGGDPGQRLPLIITHAGRAEIMIVSEYVEGGLPGFGIIYIDATASTGSS
jgi:hypothetical protein